jgi:hypothetical protein
VGYPKAEARLGSHWAKYQQPKDDVVQRVIERMNEMRKEP